MRKFKMVLLVALIISLLGGCSLDNVNVEADVSTIIIHNDGKITSVMVEDFSQSYYDMTELEQMIRNEILAYNTTAGDGHIVLESIEQVEAYVKATMNFLSYEDYAGYNSTDFFVGTIQEAQAAGYDLDVTLASAADQSVTIGMSELLDMGEEKIIISSEPIHIRSYAKIAYISEGGELVDSKEVNAAAITGLTYTILK